MDEIQLCHWLLYEPNGKCTSAFAPASDTFRSFRRVGPVASSSQFVFPLVFAVSEDLLPQGASDSSQTLAVRFLRDDKNQPGPAFPSMSTLKVATMVSELSLCIAGWIEAVGGKFEALHLLEDSDGAIKIDFDAKTDEGLKIARCRELVKAGIEMMAYARGLKGEFR